MPHYPKPFFKKARNLWYVEIDRKQINLGPDRDAAFARYHELMAASPPSEPVVSSAEGSLAAICDEFLEWTQHNRASDTYRWYRDRLQALLPHLPEHVSALRPIHVQRFIDSLSVKSGTKRNYVRSIKRALSWAEEQGLVDRSPITHMKKPRGGKRETVLSLKEFDQLISFIRDSEFKDLLGFSFTTGARAIECFAAEVRHCDLAHHRVVFPVSEEKMDRIPRVIYLPPEAEQIVDRNCRRFGEGPLFRNLRGLAWTADSVSCRFSRLAEKLGRRLCLTDLRHTWINRMLMAGVDGITVAVLAGHSDVSTISKTYQHLSQNPAFLLEQARKAIE